jgi:hypothetical protein
MTSLSQRIRLERRATEVEGEEAVVAALEDVVEAEGGAEGAGSRREAT